MKIKIGPYTSDLIPVRRWERNYEMARSDKYYLDEEDYTWYDKIILGFFDKLDAFFCPINHWSNSRKRKVKVHVDYYDVWSADHTLAMIIAPTLKKLKEVQHGYPHVDNEDVPEELRISKEDNEKFEWDGTVDSKHEARWNYILDEMIWAFEQHADPYDNESQFHHNSEQLEVTFTPLEDNPKLSSMGFNHQKDPGLPAYWVDHEGKKAHQERMQNGLRLFAKYYQCLWD